MTYKHKKIAGPERNQNQRETVLETQACNTNHSSTGVPEKQEVIPVFSMMDESAEAWNKKAARINAQSAIRRLLDERWEVAV